MTVSAASVAADAAPLGSAALGMGQEAQGAAPTQLISFAIGDDQYGVDIMAVREIKGWIDITHLPRQPDYVRGVLNLRGVIVPIIDLRCRFGQGLTEATPLHIVIIVQIASKPGRPVGRPGARHRFARRHPDPAGAAHRAGLARRTSCPAWSTVEGAMIALIDLPNLLSVQIEFDAAEGKSVAAAASH